MRDLPYAGRRYDLINRKEKRRGSLDVLLTARFPLPTTPYMAADENPNSFQGIYSRRDRENGKEKKKKNEPRPTGFPVGLDPCFSRFRFLAGPGTLTTIPLTSSPAE